MEVKADDLKRRYSSMQDDDLVALRARSGLTDEAYAVLDDVLRERNVSQAQVEVVAALAKEQKRQEVRLAIPSVEKYWRKLYLSFYALVLSILIAYMLNESRMVLAIFGVALITSAVCYYYFLGRLAYSLGRSVIAWVGVAMLVPFGLGKIISIVSMKGHVEAMRKRSAEDPSQEVAESAN